jgi:hypothetical protein
VTIVDAHADDCEHQSVLGNWTFRLTLFVTTLIVASTPDEHAKRETCCRLLGVSSSAK